jgi:hypothetical protein
MKRILTLTLATFVSFTTPLFATASNHWETAVFPNYTWKYFNNTYTPGDNWYMPEFDDQSWPEGIGGFGYGEGNDSTTLTNYNSVFLRIWINITDTSVINEALFQIDYDDAFVAFINGTEIARSAGLTSAHPVYDEFSTVEHEAHIHRGGMPDEFYIKRSKLRSLLKTGNNLLAIQVHNFSANDDDLTAIPYLSFGILSSDTFFEPTPTSLINYFATNLPIVKINTEGEEIPDEPKIQASMGVIWNEAGMLHYSTDTFNHYNGRIAIEVRGSSSQSFPKKGYGFETQDDLGENRNVKLMGLAKENDWILYAPYSDKTFLRNVLTYNLGNKIMAYAPRTRLCEMFLNNVYNGVYVLTEKIKRDLNRVHIAAMSTTSNSGDSLTGGYILKIDKGYWGNNGFMSNYTANNQNVYFLYVEPGYENITSQQKTYINNYINTTENMIKTTSYSSGDDGYLKYIDIESFIDFFIISEFSKNIDSYRISTYMYKDRNSRSGKLTMGPLWDFDLTYGNADYYSGNLTSGWVINSISEWDSYPVPFWWAKFLQDPGFQNKLKCRWTSLRSNVLSLESINTFIDTMALYLTDASTRNFETFPILGQYIWPNSYIGNSYDDEISFLKNFIEQRITWMDEHLPGTCSTDIESVSSGWFSVGPNPFSDAVTFHLSHKMQGNVVISVYDIAGRKVSVIKAYNHGDDFVDVNWDGTNGSGKPVASGVYLYTIVIDNVVVNSGKLIKSK